MSTPLALISSAFSRKAREVVHAAGRREGAGHREKHHLAAGEDESVDSFCWPSAVITENSMAGSLSPGLTVMIDPFCVCGGRGLGKSDGLFKPGIAACDGEFQRLALEQMATSRHIAEIERGAFAAFARNAADAT